MRLTKFSKKLLAYVCATALTVTSFAVPVWADKESGTVTADPLVLDGGEEGASTMINHFAPPTARNKPTDDYKYLGWCSFLDQVPDDLTCTNGNYRYLVMTYTGDITQLRFEFTRAGEKGDGSDDEKEGPYWFNPEGQTYYFVTADGSDIPLIGDNTTIVIDLAASANPNSLDGSGYGVGLDWYNSGIHMHCDEMVKHGDGAGFDITEAYLTTTLPQEETTTEVVTEAPETEPETEGSETENPETEVPETEAPTEIVTEAPETEAPATEAPTEIVTEAPETEAPTEIVTEAPETEAPTEAPTEPETLADPLILDDGDNGAFCGHTLESEADGYAYGGYVYLKGATADYKYMVLTYTGSLLNTRFEIVGDNVYWFDTWQAKKFVDLNGNDIDTSYSDEERTVYIDLEKSGAELGWGDGLHIHTENLATNGGVTFVNGYVTKTKPDVSTVTIDGKETIVANGSTVTVPANVVGYYTDGKLYAPGTEFTVTEDVEFTSVKLSMSNSASIRFAIPTAIRFMAAIDAPADVIDAVVESEGMLIAPEDYYNNAGSLDIASTYAKVNVVNRGWYNNKVGTYSAGLAGIKEANYAREFVSRAYATVTYADGTTATVYSSVSTPKSVSGVAALIQASDAYAGYSDDQKSIIDAFVQ